MGLKSKLNFTPHRTNTNINMTSPAVTCYSFIALPTGSSLGAPSSHLICLSLNCFCLSMMWQLPNEFPFITSTLSPDRLTVQCVVCYVLFLWLCPFAVSTVDFAEKNLDILPKINLAGVCARMCVHVWVHVFRYMIQCGLTYMHGHVKEGFSF